MAEIAEQRGLALTTVEGHLATFVGSGELEISRFMSKQKLEKILSTIKMSGQSYALKPVKDLLSDDFSYGEIKMAMEYYKKLNS